MGSSASDRVFREDIEASGLLLDSQDKAAAICCIIRSCLGSTLRFHASGHPKASGRPHCRDTVADLSLRILSCSVLCAIPATNGVLALSHGLSADLGCASDASP